MRIFLSAALICIVLPPPSEADPNTWLRGSSSWFSSFWDIPPIRKLSNDDINPDGIPFPMNRFTTWGSVEEADKQLYMDGLSYDQESWNIFGTNEWEFMAYGTIMELGTGSTAFQVITGTMGIIPDNEDSWDCHINHYGDYFWSELVEYDIAQYFEMLGWNENNWIANDDSEYPESELKDWFELTEEEKGGALGICYFADLWSEVPIDEWSITMGGGVTSETPSPTPGPTMGEAEAGETQSQTPLPTPRPTSGPTPRPYIRPEITREELFSTVRFTPWAELSLEQQTFVSLLGYSNETAWNTLGVHEAEYTGYDDLTGMQQDGAEFLDLDTFLWDCLMQHYYSYSWDGLATVGVQQYWVLLEWTSESWNSIIPPPATESTAYDLLTSAQQDAVLQLCYLPETWLFEGGNIEDLGFFATEGNITFPNSSTANSTSISVANQTTIV